MVLLQLGPEARPAAQQPQRSGGPAAPPSRGAALAAQQAREREERELDLAIAASARESAPRGAPPIVPGRVVGTSVPFGGGQPVVTGVVVPSTSGGRGGSIGNVNAYNDEQMRRAIAESQAAARPAPTTSVPFGGGGQPAAAGVVAASASTATSTAAPQRAARTGMSYEEQMEKVMAESRQTALLDFERRAQQLKVPSEPEDGSAGSAWIFFRIGDSTVKRRFWSDNSINNVLHFLQCHPLVFEEFGAEDIQVVNMTSYPPSVIDIAMDGPRTLQACELWPSGQIAIQRQGEDPRKALPPVPELPGQR